MKSHDELLHCLKFCIHADFKAMVDELHREKSTDKVFFIIDSLFFVVLEPDIIRQKIAEHIRLMANAYSIEC